MQKGFKVYPHEMVCGEIGCPNEQNRFVDVAAMKDRLFYAFEYKSAGDYLLRAVKQVENYRLSFDYVIVVAEIPRADVSVHPTRGVRIKEILKLGAGLWTVRFKRVKLRDLEKWEIAKIFTQISEKAPIQAHRVHENSKQITDFGDKWFWMFYSALDRRSDASTFVHAKDFLWDKRLFHPYEIVKLVSTVGKEKAVSKIAKILQSSGFRLLKDRSRGMLSQPLSIVEAAQFISKFGFNFEKLYHHYVDSSKNLGEARQKMWKDLKKQIYGVGTRSASQFIRGMVLKSSWNFPLNDYMFLEKCEFNTEIALRIGLIESRGDYYTDLAKFADEYLEGNYGVIAHVLWFIRKKYCAEHRCYECPLFSRCFARDETGTGKWVFNEVVTPKLQKPHKKNREWIRQKFNHYGMKLLKNQLHPNQAFLTDFNRTFH